MGKKHKSENDTGMSVLSIDMGIRNLAFAHLTVPPRSASGKDAAEKAKVTLNAWHRIEIGSHDMSTLTSGEREEAPPKEEQQQQVKGEEGEVVQNVAYTPDIYATHAYALLTTLLQNYNPTHILIERQRFRSANGSAVQEWSLRVGVFEGMLYAVLYTIAMQRQYMRSLFNPSSPPLPSVPSSGLFGSGNPTDFGNGPVVNGIEPSRVLRYWGERIGFSTFVLNGKAKKSAKDGKKVKIDLAGHWLDPNHPTTEDIDGAGGDLSTSLVVGEDVGLNETVHAYLAKWHKKCGKDKGKDIGKLDDLADCLVQGVTWLEWQVMRDRVLREGVGFVFDES